MNKFFGILFIILLILGFRMALRMHKKIKPTPFSDLPEDNINGSGSQNDIGKG